MAAKQVVNARFDIYKGLPFYQKLFYRSQNDGAIDTTDWIGLLQLKADVNSEAVLYTWSTSPEAGEGEIVLGDGFIELKGPTDEETDAFEWEQAVGHLVIGPTQDKVAPIAFFAFDVKPSTTGVPPLP